MNKVFCIKRLLRTVISVAAIAGVALFSSGCLGDMNERVRPDVYTGSLYGYPEDTHPIQVSKGKLSMGLSVRRKATKLLPYERNEVRQFLHYFNDQATGRMLVSLPSNSRYQGAVRNVLLGLQREFVEMGLEPEMIKVKRYNGRGDKYPVIHLSFSRYVANASDCYEWNENLAVTENNRPAQYWGCATQNNLAAMVANPRDLKGPRGWSPRDAQRRDTVWGKYVKGEATSAERTQDERVNTRSKK